MQKRELLKQLNNLKQEISPDPLWQKKNRDILLSQIKAQTSSDFVFSCKILFKNVFLAAYKPLGAVILIFGILFGSWTASVGAAKKSLPGDFWYDFKLTTERMQVNLTLNDEKRTNLEIAFAERRLDELKQTSGKNKNDKKSIDITLKKFQESLNNVKTSMAKLEITDKQKALKVADLVDQKTKEYINIIKDQQQASPQLAENKVADEAIIVTKATADKALDLIIKDFENGQSDMILDQVKEKINSRIVDLEKNLISDKSSLELILANKKIADAAVAAKALADKKAAEAEAKTEAEAKAKAEAEAKKAEEAKKDQSADNTNNNANTNSAPSENINAETNTNTDQRGSALNTNSNANNTEVVQPEEVLPGIEEMKDKFQEIEILLSKAKDLLKNNSISQAYDNVKQADDIQTLLEKVIKANDQYLINPDNTASDNTAIDNKPEANLAPKANG